MFLFLIRDFEHLYSLLEGVQDREICAIGCDGPGNDAAKSLTDKGLKFMAIRAETCLACLETAPFALCMATIYRSL